MRVSAKSSRIQPVNRLVSPMNILAIDTSTTACVLGVRTEDTEITRFEQIDRSHSLELLPRIVTILADANLDKNDIHLIVFGKGPGSFTGLRIAVGVTQGLAFGLDIPVVGVSTLACIAQGRFRKSVDGTATHVIVAQTARQEELFYGAYDVSGGIARLVQPEGVYLANEVPVLPEGPWVGVGSGWSLADKINFSSGAGVSDISLEAWPEGEDLLVLGNDAFNSGAAVTAAQAIPEYLREQVATPAKPKTHKI